MGPPDVSFAQGDVIAFDLDDAPDQEATVLEIETRKARGIAVLPLPQQNATLRAVSLQAGIVRDQGEEITVGGATKWSGDAPAYYHEKRIENEPGGGLALILRRSLIVNTRRGNVRLTLQDL